MKWHFIVRPEAEQDIAEAFDWYEEQRKGLGDDFLLRVEAAFDSLVHDPYVYAPSIKIFVENFCTVSHIVFSIS